MNQMKIYSINAALKIKDCRQLVIRDKNRNLWMAKIIPDGWGNELPCVELYWQPFETGTFRSINVVAPSSIAPAVVVMASYGRLRANDIRIASACAMAAADIAEALDKMWLDLHGVESYEELHRLRYAELRKEISEERNVA